MLIIYNLYYVLPAVILLSLFTCKSFVRFVLLSEVFWCSWILMLLTSLTVFNTILIHSIPFLIFTFMAVEGLVFWLILVWLWFYK